MNVDTVAGDTAPSAAVLNARPLRNEESASWELEDGLAVITHAKEFSRLEGWVRDRIGGPGELRRPLDRFTTFLWLKCDGVHTVAGLVAALEAEFGARNRLTNMAASALAAVTTRGTEVARDLDEQD